MGKQPCSLLTSISSPIECSPFQLIVSLSAERQLLPEAIQTLYAGFLAAKLAAADLGLHFRG